MAREIENININGEAYEISKIYSKMGLTFERFVELLERDFYSPVLSADPTSTVTTYTDTDGENHDFQRGQFALVADASVPEGYRVWQCLSNDGTEAVWISPSEKADKEDIPTKISQLIDDVGMVTSKDTDGSVDDVEIEYQEKLVSGTNIKTINGESILGSGNIVIEGGSSSGGTSSGSAAYPLVEHGTSDTTFTLTPNTFHVWDEVASLDLSFGDETSGVANEFLFQFTSGATATTLTLPDDIKWANDTAPTIAENMIYQVSVLRGLASVLEFSNAAESAFPLTITGNSTTEEGKLAYQELEKLGESGTLAEGLLYISFMGNLISVTTFSYDSSRSAYHIVQGFSSWFLDADGYCFNVIID